MNSEPRQPLTTDQIATLSTAATTGDANALERLICHYHLRFLGFAIRRVGVDWKGKIEPEDVLQEAYISVFNSITSFENRYEESFYYWVTNIIGRRFIDRIRHLRRKQRDVGREVDNDRMRSSLNNLLSRCDPNLVTPSVNARRAEATSALLACIHKLPDHHREIVCRRFLNEESTAEIAADLGTTEDAVRGVANRAIGSLAKCLGQATLYLSK